MICVLLSTYNGEDYLTTLLDSLLAQDYPDIKILIRDDGSTDRTRKILSDYAAEHGHIETIQGSNVGANRSFFELLASVPEGADYAAFCDQDDYWESDKLSRALGLLAEHRTDGPAMYFSRLTIADGDLNTLSLTAPPPRGPSFENALVENIATGATIVLNRAAVDLVAGHTPDIDKVEMYDWWIYQTVSALGTVLFDDQSRIKSRQHSRNVVGLPFGTRRWRSKYRFIGSRDKRKISTQAGEFSRIFQDRVSEEHRCLLDEFLAGVGESNILGRTRYAIRGRVHRQKTTDDLLLKLRIVLGLV